MKSLVKLGIMAFAFGLFATACNNAGNQNADQNADSVVEEAPVEQVTPPADSVAAPADTTLADSANL